MTKIKATYVSVWDGGTEIRTACIYDPISKVISEIETTDEEIEDLDVLDREYIELPDGTEIAVEQNEDGEIVVSYEGTEGQDRKSYTDTQDREDYTDEEIIEPELRKGLLENGFIEPEA